MVIRSITSLSAVVQLDASGMNHAKIQSLLVEITGFVTVLKCCGNCSAVVSECPFPRQNALAIQHGLIVCVSVASEGQNEYSSCPQP
jgi:hypothetical protein